MGQTGLVVLLFLATLLAGPADGRRCTARLVFLGALPADCRAGEGGEAGITLRSIDEESPELAEARAAWERGDFADAERRYAQALQSDLPAAVKMRVEFLRARLLYAAGQHERAGDAFEKLIPALPELADWSRYYAGRADALAGRPDDAVALLDEVGDSFPWKGRASELACVARFSGRSQSSGFLCADAHRPRFGTSAALELAEARSHLALRMTDDGVTHLKGILVSFPTSDEALEAERLLGEIGKEGKGTAVGLTPAEELAQAGVLLGKYRYARVLKIAQRLLRSEPKKGEAWCGALALSALAWARKKEETRSLKAFGQVVELCPAQATPEFLYRGVEAARAASRPKEALAWARELAERFPESTLCDDALLFAAVAFQRKGNAARARKLLTELLEQFPAGDMAPEAAWLLVQAEYDHGRFRKALGLAEKYLPLLPERQDYKSNGRLEYWIGRCLQHLKKPKDAAVRFEAVLARYPLSWYALLAHARLEQMKTGSGDEALRRAAAASAAVLPGLPEALAALGPRREALKPALLLLELGLREEAQAELGRVLPAAAGEEEAGLLAAAWLYGLAHDYATSHNVLRRQVAEFQYAWPQGDDDRWWKSAFPPAYLALLQSGAEAAGIPWTLAAAVTREESGFEARIESYAHALGLMQLLLKTAAGTAGRKLTREEVFDPRTNIELGTKYLRGLLDETGHPALAVAAYNCGPGGVRRSLREYKGNEIDEMVEHIGYDQTRRYTKRVMSSAWAYQYLYGGEGVVPFPLTFERTLMKDRE